MNIEVETYSLVLHRLAESDHGWGKPYDFHELYALDYAVPAVENSSTDFAEPAGGRVFDDMMKSGLQAKSVELPPLTFIHSFLDVYDASRQGPIQIRNGGAFIALGPIDVDMPIASVGAMFYAGHHWARWMRYYLEQADGVWRIMTGETLAVS